MKILKTLFLFMACFSITAISVWALNYDVTIPIKGKTLASTQLQQNSLFSVYSFATRVADTSCQNISIINSKVDKPKKNGVWEETWTVQACQKQIFIPIVFTETSYDIDPMKVHHIVIKK